MRVRIILSIIAIHDNKKICDCINRKQEVGYLVFKVCVSPSALNNQKLVRVSGYGSELLYFLNGGKETATKLKISM